MEMGYDAALERCFKLGSNAVAAAATGHIASSYEIRACADALNIGIDCYVPADYISNSADIQAIFNQVFYPNNQSEPHDCIHIIWNEVQRRFVPLVKMSSKKHWKLVKHFINFNKMRASVLNE